MTTAAVAAVSASFLYLRLFPCSATTTAVSATTASTATTIATTTAATTTTTATATATTATARHCISASKFT
ncbi:hypothetical protein CLOM_g13505 [Closterium sp. NIES-68]|nr:hypothetical protein CLOM_g13505 [Closterium sp. NIES-68]GJP78647.1 hypothetical protein CLOP_g8923 [Closterium sp. NIES-67]